MSDACGQRPVGVIGLGLLGKALAGRLMANGYAVCGWDVDDAARASAEAMGVSVLMDHHAVAAACDIIFMSLPDSEVRQALLWGDGGLASSLAEGTLLLDTTTGRPEDTVRDHQMLGEMQVDLVDVCVLGSSAQVAAGAAVLLVGDSEDRAGGYRPYLNPFAQAVFFLGKPGDGCRMKLVANQVLGLHRLVLAESLAMAEKSGLDPEKTLAVLMAGPAASAVMEVKGRRMLDADFEPVARLAQHAKDVGLILALGRECGATMPLSELHQSLLAQLVDRGHGGEDNSAVIRAFRGAAPPMAGD